ncbi:ligase-associated DNA damage response endonuclease PdeM [Alteromonas oceanisediminis]|uniref:ligase-associated DNA damage response endonuclease PdeM n=1 Tax=Alteromonas oceanisediminis TaxID=2836180 RepID=UPI001BDAAE0D|nr:ligase-associated DNA damage response endonuclease PdeM [Alteromonas oceanisediminis]MBT0586966.1 ligase-associated DNA damage response endonuclease PdeM [Alteromonas oceanisediminis]
MNNIANAFSRAMQRAESRHAVPIKFAGNTLFVDGAGCLFWPAHDMLIVSDLHFEKGSYFAVLGSPVPNYDSRKTLQQLAHVIKAYQPRHTVCLGDSFHDQRAWQRLDESLKVTLRDLIQQSDRWTWIVGNHDPELPEALSGEVAHTLVYENVLLSHEPECPLPAGAEAQIFGHFHPKLSYKVARQRLTGKCAVYHEHRLIMPAFGAYTGGLSIDDPAITELVPKLNRRAVLLYADKAIPL